MVILGGWVFLMSEVPPVAIPAALVVAGDVVDSWFRVTGFNVPDFSWDESDSRSLNPKP